MLHVDRAAALSLLLTPCVLSHAADPSTLARIRAANTLRCGIDAEQAEYSTTDDHGNRAAFDADICRAVAVAVLGKAAQTEISQYPDDTAAMAALRAGEVDLIPTLTDDFTHTAATGLAFTRPLLWDGVGFLVPVASPVTRARQLSGKKICFLAETAVEEDVRAWFIREHLDFVPFPFQEEGEMQAAFATGNCAALAGDRTRLAQTRAAMARHNHPTRLLPETISDAPLAAAVRDGDPQWFSIVNWVMEALIQSEASGITQSNVRSISARNAQSQDKDHAQVQDQDPIRRFLLGDSHQIGTALGLDNNWVANVIEATGNYGEIYQRDLGSGSPLKLPRAGNRLYKDGGLMQAIPPR